LTSRADNRIHHLTVDVVLEIHSAANAEFGGNGGVREMALLEAAVAAPRASIGGRPAFSDPVQIAGAYLFFLCLNNPFYEGIRRTALGSCLVFLRLNRVNLQPDGMAWEELMLGVSSLKLDRVQATSRLRALVVA
jgi:death-on-curing protein